MDPNTTLKLMRDLDEWLSKGGFPPKDWQAQDTWR